MAHNVSVESSSPNFVENILVSEHRIIADEPIEAGGTNLGPSPYELLLGALGACKAITVRMFAARKGWPLRDVRLNLSHEKSHAHDCSNCENSAAQIDRIDVQIEIIGSELTVSQREILLAVAQKCPIHRTLAGQLQIRTMTV